MFKHAIVRIPGKNFAEGLTTAGLGAPDYKKALEQHQQYCQALRDCGLELTLLEAAPDHPDAEFVEDAAILTPGCAILTNPGAESRKGEVAAVREVLGRFYTQLETITAPGTLDGGDVCEAGSHFFIGLSERTNEEGARQLAAFLARQGYTSSCIPVMGIPGILHLKSGIAYLGDGRLVLVDPFVGREEFKGYDVIRVSPEENYAANCVRVNDRVILAAGYPRLQQDIERLGYPVLLLEMSEYQKMDGGLSCLSLRF
jgi:dimethylargininase